jgi:long-chain fatty acid transport protein
VFPTLFSAGPLPQAPDVALGIGVYSPFGLGSRWPDDSLMRYGSTLGEIALVNVNPTAAVKLSEKLSLGAGIDVFTGTVKLRNMIDYSAYGLGDGQVKLEADGRGWGYNFGLQYQWGDTITLGFTYRSPVHVGYDGDAQFDGVPTIMGPMSFSYSADARIDYPAVVAGAVSWQSTEKLRLEFVAEWTQWSTRDSQAVSIHAPAQFQQSPAIINWDDSWVLMLGAEYVLNDRWTLRCGYGYNQTPAPASTADPSLPAGDTHAIALGAGYRISEHATLDVACVVAYARRRELHSIQAQALQYAGDYDAFSTYFSLGFTWNF